jgi:uncharacterized protein
MSSDTLDHTFRWVFASGLAREPFTLLWHAGEPLVLPVSFYETADELRPAHTANVPILQSFQTNATLIDAGWCELIRRRNIHMGVSVDGPAFLHDRCRRTRRGAGTLDRVLGGIRCLQEHGIPLHVITVLTADSLAYPDELFDFYLENGITEVAFNVEEIEGPNTTSSLLGHQVQERFRRFLSRFLDLALSADPPLLVREFETSATLLLGVPRVGRTRTQENKPWAIVNVDCEGNFSTYSPELLGVSSPTHGGFTLGNVVTDSRETVQESARFRRMEDEIRRGVEMCRELCVLPLLRADRRPTSISRTGPSSRPRPSSAGCTRRSASTSRWRCWNRTRRWPGHHPSPSEPTHDAAAQLPVRRRAALPPAGRLVSAAARRAGDPLLSPSFRGDRRPTSFPCWCIRRTSRHHPRCWRPAFVCFNFPDTSGRVGGTCSNRPRGDRGGASAGP